MNSSQPLSRLVPFRYLLYGLGALVLTWPLGLRLGSHLPLGTEGAATVPLFNLWTLLWNTNRLQQGFTAYWDAPIFFPEPGAFALSEPQPLTGLLFSFFLWLIRNPLTAYNLVLLLFLTLNGISADRLLRTLGVGAGPALFGGLLALALPFVGNELGVLQLTAVFPLFFTLGALFSFARSTGWRSALSIGAWTATAFLLSAYYGLFLTIFLLLGGLCLGQKAHLRGKLFLQLGAGALLAVLLLLPVLPEQRRLTADYNRGDPTIRDNSAEPDEYLRLYRRTLGEQFLPWLLEDDGRQRLFPGTALLLLGLTGLVAGLYSPSTRRWAIFAISGTTLAFILSLGLNLSLGEWQPYRLLKDHYPGFAQLRSPFRLAVFVQLFLVGLAGLGLNALWQKRGGPLLAAVLLALALVEVIPQPARLYAPPDQLFHAPWSDWLKSQPDEGAVLMLPMSQDSSAAAFEPIVIGMLQSLEHGRPLGNGYSGFFPASYRSLKGRLLHFPDAETIQHLQTAGFTFLVIDKAWWNETQPPDLSPWAPLLTPVYQDETKLILKINEPTS